MLSNRDASSASFPLLSLDKQVELVEKHGVETLLFCPDPWALRHVFIDQETGETVRARCNRWDCLYCGLRKVDQWRQMENSKQKRGRKPILLPHLHSRGERI